MYAQDTSVSCERSKAEIERILTRYGAEKFGYINEAMGATVQFVKGAKCIRFFVPMPKRPDESVRGGMAAVARWERGQRQKWRALTLVIKAKLEAV